jgi:hypothetical protein
LSGKNKSRHAFALSFGMLYPANLFVVPDEPLVKQQKGRMSFSRMRPFLLVTDLDQPACPAASWKARPQSEPIT